jgi:hypothetical protein
LGRWLGWETGRRSCRDGAARFGDGDPLDPACDAIEALLAKRAAAPLAKTS